MAIISIWIRLAKQLNRYFQWSFLFVFANEFFFDCFLVALWFNEFNGGMLNDAPIKSLKGRGFLVEYNEALCLSITQA